MRTPQREFSRRERQIVYAILQAKAAKDIARELGLSVNTVKDYLKTIYRKAEVHSARELMCKYSPSRLACPDTGLAQLLQCAQRLSAEAAPEQALVQLHGAVRACTRARRVSFWRWLRSGSDRYLAGEASSTRPGSVLRVEAFAGRLRAQGWARLAADEVGGLDGREFASQGLGGEIIGVACAPSGRVQVMLAGDPAEGCFGPLDLAVIRLLARLCRGAEGDESHTLQATA
ncbi:MAG: helix-turn-helix domain-containing protein [Terriglobales bacterium]